MQIKKSDSSVRLPAEISVPSSCLGDYSVLLYGEPKVGKTSLAACFPEVLGLMFEPGAKALRMYQSPIKIWEDFCSVLDQLEKTGRFKSILIDTVDEAYKRCLAYVCQKEGFDSPSDEGYGKGWSKVNNEFSLQITRLLHLRRGIIFTSHAAERDIKTRLGEEYTKIVPTMSGGARSFCEALVDVWLYMYHDKAGERMLRIRGNDHIAAGHRLQENFKGIELIPAGKDARAAYDNLVAAFNNNLQKPESARPRLRLGSGK